MRKLLRIAIVCMVAFVFGATTVHAAKSHKETISLDGEWQIIFDENNQSTALKLYESANFLAQKNIENITVPSVWERVRQDYEGVAVYRKNFMVPKTLKGKITHLSFDAVNYRAEVYVNDNVVGVHEGGFTPFSFRVDSMLKFGGDNVVTLRVLGPILLDKDKVIDGMGAMETPQWRGGITGGIWQSVRLVVTEKNYIEDVFIEPNIHNNTAKVTLELHNFDEYYSQDSVKLTVRDAGKIVATTTVEIKLQPGKNIWSDTIAIPGAKRWSPDSPNLYTLETQVSDADKSSDSVSERFGMREFTVKDKKFQLNGEDIYVKAVFLEGVYPVGVAAPVNLDLARKEILRAKEAGFNMIRPWRRPPPPEWLDLADELGALVIGSPALECMDLPYNTPDLPRRVLSEISMTIKRDRNRASIVMWELFNELRRPVLKQMMAETAMMARDADPSRLILDESGGWAFGAKVYLPYKRDFERFNDVHTYPGPNVTNAWYDRFLGVSLTKAERKKRGITGRPIGHHLKKGATSFVSELGYGSYVDFGKVNKRFRAEGNPIVPPTRYHRKLENQLTKVLTGPLSAIYKTPQDFYLEQQHIHGLANARMIEAARANPLVTGYCVHALTGGDWIMGAGLLDLWREPKKAVFDMTKAANQPQILSIRSWPRSAYQGEDIKFTVTGINDLKPVEGKLSVSIIAANGDIVWRKTEDVDYGHRVSKLLSDTLATKSLNGRYQIKASLTSKDGRTLANNRYEFDVFDIQNPQGLKRVAVLDQAGSLKAFLAKREMPFEAFSNKTSIKTPVFVAMKQKPNDKQAKDNKRLTAFAKRGGTVVYLQFPAITPKFTSGVLSKGATKHLPISVEVKMSSGLWGGMSHVVYDHPAFKGLPVKKAMVGVYENVRPKFSLVGGKGQHYVTLVANDNFPDMTLSKRHYKGPGDVWTGSDLSEVPFGKGKIWLSTMRLLPNLGKDPVADKILLNLLAHIAAK